MKYFRLTFHLSPSTEMHNDVLSALLADIGFETFVTDEENNLQAYVQQALFDEQNMEQLITEFPLPDTTIEYVKDEPENKDWNETWEEEGFQPITIDERLVVCDTHHEITQPVNGCKILIHPRQAFGTGSHQTTRMLLNQLLDMPLESLSVIDAGCGTGILGFCCLKQGASHVLGYDIDEWSVENTLNNAALNFDKNDNRLQVKLGDSSVLEGEEPVDLLIANINRNILLGDMKRFSEALKPHGQLLLSGFYNTDAAILIKDAAQYGFKLKQERHDEEWTMLLLER